MKRVNGTKFRLPLSIYCLGVLMLTACATEPKDGVVRRKRSSEKIDLISVSTARSVISESCSIPARNQELRLWLDRAGRCVSDKNWTLLEKLAQQLAQSHIELPWGAYFLSVAAEGRGEYARSLWMIGLAEKKADTENPSETGLFAYQKGRIYFALKETSRAMSEIKKAISFEPRLIEGHIFLAEIYHRDQELEQAKYHYKQALQLNPDHQRASAGLATLEPARVPAQQEGGVK